jgi:hypothetical protein
MIRLTFKLVTPTYCSHSIIAFLLNYNFWKVLSNTGMWMGAWFNPTSNAFSTKDVVDAFGKRTSQTVNVNGNYSFGAYMGYNFKIKKTRYSS